MSNKATLWTIAGSTAGVAAVGAVLSVLFNGVSGAADVNTLLTWTGVGAGIGFLRGVADAAGKNIKTDNKRKTPDKDKPDLKP